MSFPKPIRYTIYCHTHTESGRRYIGLTKLTMMKRWNQHVMNACAKKGKGCAYFWAAIRKYGKDAFSHEVLEICDTLDEANLAEQKWIEHFDTRNPERGFNLKKGGSHVPHPIKNPWDRPEYREKHTNDIAVCLTPEARAKMTATHRSPEFQAKRSAISKQFQADPEYRIRMSLSSQAALAKPEVKAQLSAASRARKPKPVSDKTREKLRLVSSGRHHSEQTLGRIRAGLADKDKHVLQDGRVVGLKCQTHGLVLEPDFLVTKWPSGSLRIVCRLCAREADKRRKDQSRQRRGLPICQIAEGGRIERPTLRSP